VNAPADDDDVYSYEDVVSCFVTYFIVIDTMALMLLHMGGTDLPKCGVDETLIVMPQSFCVCHSGIIIIIQGGHSVLEVLEFFSRFSRPRKVIENAFVI